MRLDEEENDFFKDNNFGENFKPDGDNLNPSDKDIKDDENSDYEDDDDDNYYDDDDLLDKIFDEDMADMMCPFHKSMDTLIYNTGISKPFGIKWEDEDIIEFLTLRGYEIITGKDEVTLAIKPGTILPNEDDKDYFKNMIDIVFDKECREISKKLLIKLSKWIGDGK